MRSCKHTQVWILQLGVAARPPVPAPAPAAGPVDSRMIEIARLMVRAGGRLGDELIIPWALAGLPEPAPGEAGKAHDPLSRARELRDELVAEVWGLPAEEALSASRACLAGVLGPDPIPALELISGLRPPDQSRACRLLALVDELRSKHDVAPPRLGVGRWEPFVTGVVLAAGEHRQGTPAAPGAGAGVRRHIADPSDLDRFTPRAVITSPRPIPNLAPLLWDAAGIVTATGSHSAHLFESARALGIPAVTGVEIPDGDQIVAIDGHTGLVAALTMNGDGNV